MGTTERPLSGGCTADPALAARERVEGSGATSLKWFLRQACFGSFCLSGWRDSGRVPGLLFLRKEQLT